MGRGDNKRTKKSLQRKAYRRKKIRLAKKTLLAKSGAPSVDKAAASKSVQKKKK